MIKVKKYSNEQIHVIQNKTHSEILFQNLFSILNQEELSKSQKTIEMFKQLLCYMAMRKNELLNADIKKKDVDYIVKQELNDLNLILKELQNAIPKNS